MVAGGRARVLLISRNASGVFLISLEDGDCSIRWKSRFQFHMALKATQSQPCKIN